MISSFSHCLRNLSVRMAKLSDGDFVKVQIMKLTQLAEGFSKPPVINGIDETWKKIISDKNNNAVFLAEDNGVKIGAAVCSLNYSLHKGGQYCYLEELIVDDTVRSVGAGTELLKAVEKFAKDKGMISVDLTQPPPGSNFDSERSKFYQKRGFDTTGMSRTKQFRSQWDLSELE